MGWCHMKLLLMLLLLLRCWTLSWTTWRTLWRRFFREERTWHWTTRWENKPPPQKKSHKTCVNVVPLALLRSFSLFSFFCSPFCSSLVCLGSLLFSPLVPLQCFPHIHLCVAVRHNINICCHILFYLFFWICISFSLTEVSSRQWTAWCHILW